MEVSTVFPPLLADYVKSLPNEFTQISSVRKAKLQAVSQYILEKQQAGKTCQVTVICTHNSRRSHFGQVWLQIAAAWYNVSSFTSFSGGTEATAFHPNAVQALQQAGVPITLLSDQPNPLYKIQFQDSLPAVTTFSKKYTHPDNPAQNFAALMVCTQADQGCPLVIGAEARFSLPYDDPKDFDGTAQEATKYAERCRQIASEMFFIMNLVSSAN